MLVNVLFPDSNSCRQRGTAASHVARVKSVSIWRLSCRWYCLQWFMQFCLWLCIVLWNGNGALAELHLLTRGIRWAGDCGGRKSAMKAKIYDSNRHFSRQRFEQSRLCQHWKHKDAARYASWFSDALESERKRWNRYSCIHILSLIMLNYQQQICLKIIIK